MDSFDVQVQCEEIYCHIFSFVSYEEYEDFMAEILSTCSEEEIEEIFSPIKNPN